MAAVKKSAGQKPINVPKRHGHLYHRDAIWSAIRQLGEFSVLDIEDKTRIDMSTISSYVMGLSSAGYITPLETGEKGNAVIRKGSQYTANRWKLEHDIGIEAPNVLKNGQPCKRNLSREQMWRTMKMLGEFSYRDLIVNASTEDVTIPATTAKDYIKYLTKARYLVVVQPSTPGTPARYRLLPSRNTGPRPPMIQRIKQVFDPNLGKVVWPEEEEQS